MPWSCTPPVRRRDTRCEHTQTCLLYCAGLTLCKIGDAGPVWMAPTQTCHISGLVCMVLPRLWKATRHCCSRRSILPGAPAFGESYCVAYTIALPPMIVSFQQACMEPTYDTGKANQTFLVSTVLYQPMLVQMAGILSDAESGALHGQRYALHDREGKFCARLQATPLR